MNFLQTMNSQAMAVGYIVEIIVLGLLVWHAVVAWRRRRATREARLSEQIKARVQSQPVTRDAYGDTPLGI